MRHASFLTLTLPFLLLACSGGGGSSSSSSATTWSGATTLAYVNPSSSSYQLVKNSASTSTHLLLDLVGPANSAEVSGVGFYLSVDSTKASWGTVSGSAKAASSVFSSPLVKYQANGGTLQVGIYQLGTTAAITATSSTVLATVALDLISGVTTGSSLSLAAPSGKALILNAPGSSSATTPITISVGALTAQ